VFIEVFTKHTNWKVDKAPFIRIPYLEAMEKYGSDKPDLRNPLIIQDVTDIFEKIDLKVFSGKIVRTIILPDGASKSRTFYDEMTDFAVKECKAKGLAWLKVLEDGTFQGPIAKFIDDDSRKEFMERTGAKPGDSIFFIAEHEGIVEKMSGAIRQEIAVKLDMIPKDEFAFCWIVDFPMYELSDEGKIEFCHNPFSMPQGGLETLNNQKPLDILAYQYDIVCNGIELSSGAVRNHDPEIMIKAFEIAGYDKKVIEEKFPALFNAFHYGAPPHAGIAPGIDRILMMLKNENNIREVIAFPMNSKAEDLLMGAPGRVTDKQLEEVHIKIVEE
jgi:aspartyl-tRNA synthetase